MRDVDTRELQEREVDMWAEAPEIATKAVQVAYFGFKELAYHFPSDGQMPLGERFLVRWFDDPAIPLAGRYDGEKNHIWINAALLGNPAEICKTIGHEIFHAVEVKNRWRINHEAAEGNGERLLDAWRKREEAIEAKARDASAKAAALAARAFRRHFPGSSFDAAYDEHAFQTVEARQPHARAQYGYEVEGKYNTAWLSGTNSSVGEGAFGRLEAFASDLFQLVVQLNRGRTDAWDSTGWYDRVASLYSGDLGRNAGGSLEPTMGRQASINTGLADLQSRLDFVRELEKQMGSQLATFRAARGALAAPTSDQIARLLPPRIPHRTFVGSTST